MPKYYFKRSSRIQDKVRNSYEDFEEDMNTFVQESDQKCYKLYKCVDDIIEI